MELPLAITQRLSRRPGEISMVAVSIAPGYRVTDLERTIERVIPGTLALGDPGEVARVDTNGRIITRAAIIIAALALLLGAVAGDQHDGGGRDRAPQRIWSAGSDRYGAGYGSPG